MERERHATCLSRANATRRQRRTLFGFAALPSLSRGWGEGKRRERERHAMCLPRAIATRRRLRT